MAWPALTSSTPYWTLLADDADDWTAWQVEKSTADGYVLAPHFNLAATVNVHADNALGTTGLLYRQLSPAVDLSRGTSGLGYVIEVQWYLDTGLPTATNQVVLRFYSGALNTNNSIGAVLAYTNTTAADKAEIPGWHKTYLPMDMFTIRGANWQDSWWANLSYAALYVVPANPGGVFNVRLGSIRALPPLEKAVVVLGADDGYDEHLWFAQQMSARAIPGTFFCVKRLLDLGQAGDATKLSWDDALAIQRAGHLIGNHSATYNSGVDWTADTPAGRVADVAACRDAFVAHGLRGGRILATPGGEFDTTADAEWTEGGDYDNLVTGDVVDHVRLVKQYCRGAAGSIGPYLPYPPALSYCTALNKWDYTTLLPRLIAQKAISLFFLHEIDGAGGNPDQAEAVAMLDALVAARDAGSIYIASFEEVLEQVYGVTVGAEQGMRGMRDSIGLRQLGVGL